MGAHPAEGPSCRAVVRMDSLQLVSQLAGHSSKGTSAQRFHDHTLHAHLLTFPVEVLRVSINATTTPHGCMTPVQEVHLDLHEVPFVFVLTVQQPVKVAHVAMIRETQVLDASCLTFLEQEFQHAVVQETPFQCLHATANAVQQVVVDVIHLQTFERLLVHTLRIVEVPQPAVLVRHLRGHVVFLPGMACEGIARQHLRLSAHVHGSRVEVVHAVLNGIIYELVHLILIVGQSHHAEAQQRDLFARTILRAVGHAFRSFF